MGTMPENKLLLSMAVPMMLSMLVQALYNVVDSIFVSRISEDALTAVSLAFPVQNLLIAVGVGTGVGINALLSKSLGEKNQKLANKTAHNGIILMFLSAIVCALFGVFGSHWFFNTQTDNPVLIDYGTKYLSIVMTFSFGIFGQFITERLLQATGRTTLSMYTQLVGAVTNLILDPILIFGWFGLPAMGITGAAVATVAGQILSALFGVWLNLKKNPDIQLSFKELVPDGVVIKKIYSVGVPSIVMGSIGSVMTYGLNQILMGFSSTATAVFGVYFKLQSFIFMPVFGLNNGMVPIIAYNLVLPHIYVDVSFLYINFADNKCLPQRPYMVRLTIFKRLLVPSTKPLLLSLETAFSTASISLSNPLANEAISFMVDFLWLSINRYSKGTFFLLNIIRNSETQAQISYKTLYLSQRNFLCIAVSSIPIHI